MDVVRGKRSRVVDFFATLEVRVVRRHQQRRLGIQRGRKKIRKG